VIFLTLYVRQDCHLCEEMRTELEPWRSRLGFNLQVVDISGDPALIARYGRKAPVLARGEDEICYYFLDESALQDYLKDP
jgi:hypothetical protein